MTLNSIYSLSLSSFKHTNTNEVCMSVLVCVCTKTHMPWGGVPDPMCKYLRGNTNSEMRISWLEGITKKKKKTHSFTHKIGCNPNETYGRTPLKRSYTHTKGYPLFGDTSFIILHKCKALSTTLSRITRRILLKHRIRGTCAPRTCLTFFSLMTPHNIFHHIVVYGILPKYVDG